MDTTLTLRRARPDDLDQVDRLLRASYPRLLKADYPPSVMVLALPLISKARPELLASGRYFIVEGADGAILGAGGWSLSSPLDGRGIEQAAQVRHVATHPDHLRQGIGRAILGEVVVDCLRHGLRWLDCLSTRTAVPFYERLGFRMVQPMDVNLGPGIRFPALRMLRQISL
jgi:N-acetylglutamate synthase-like GNAT family acetyltransferase